MKKICILLLILFVNICASAQIQRNFFSFTLGETPKSEVIKYFKSKKYKTNERDDETLIITDLKFAGHTWPFSAISFYNGILNRVYFADNENYTSLQTLDLVWEDLSDKISKKYSDYYNYNLSNNESKIYYDDNTRFSIDYIVFDGVKGLSLMYTDRKLLNEESDNDANDL